MARLLSSPTFTSPTRTPLRQLKGSQRALEHGCIVPPLPSPGAAVVGWMRRGEPGELSSRVGSSEQLAASDPPLWHVSASSGLASSAFTLSQSKSGTQPFGDTDAAAPASPGVVGHRVWLSSFTSLWCELPGAPGGASVRPELSEGSF